MMNVRFRLLLLVGLLSPGLLASACSHSDETGVPSTQSTIPATPADTLKAIAHRDSGDYTVTLFNETGAITNDADRFTIEFRRNGELASVDNLKVQTGMDMPGMAPMTGSVSIVPAHDAPGRYNVSTNRFGMAGMWKMVVSFDPGHSVEFTATVH
jgi:hypothetical protein